MADVTSGYASHSSRPFEFTFKFIEFDAAIKPIALPPLLVVEEAIGMASERGEAVARRVLFLRPAGVRPWRTSQPARRLTPDHFGRRVDKGDHAF